MQIWLIFKIFLFGGHHPRIHGTRGTDIQGGSRMTGGKAGWDQPSNLDVFAPFHKAHQSDMLSCN